MDNSIRSYGEFDGVDIEFDKEEQRWVIVALNEGGYNSTVVDLMDVVDWYNENKDKL